MTENEKIERSRMEREQFFKDTLFNSWSEFLCNRKQAFSEGYHIDGPERYRRYLMTTLAQLFLDAYEIGCIYYLKDRIDKDIFEGCYKEEIISLFSSEKSPFILLPATIRAGIEKDEGDTYKNLRTVYKIFKDDSSKEEKR